MQFRTLGRDGPEISVVGVGAWAIGGPWQFDGGRRTTTSPSPPSTGRSTRGDLADTAAVYGSGTWRRSSARWSASTAARCWCSPSAAGPGTGGSTTSPPTTCGPRRSASSSSRASSASAPTTSTCTSSTGLEMETGTPVEDSWATMAELVDEGKVRWAGVSNFGVELLERCQRVRHVDAVQPPYSLIDRAAAEDVIHGRRPTAAGSSATACSGRACSAAASTPNGPQPARGRLAPGRPGLLPAEAGGQPRAGPAAGAGGRAPLGPGGRRGRGLGPGHPGGDRGDRRGPAPSQVDGWLPAGNLRLTDEDLAALAWSSPK